MHDNKKEISILNVLLTCEMFLLDVVVFITIHDFYS